MRLAHNGGNFDGTQGSREAVIASVRRTGLDLLPFENGGKRAVKVEKRALNGTGGLLKMAEPTGLEPATSDVTGQNFLFCQSITYFLGQQFRATTGNNLKYPVSAPSTGTLGQSLNLCYKCENTQGRIMSTAPDKV
jgi:hypothetical protein